MRGKYGSDRRYAGIIAEDVRCVFQERVSRNSTWNIVFDLNRSEWKWEAEIGTWA